MRTGSTVSEQQPVNHPVPFISTVNGTRQTSQLHRDGDAHAFTVPSTQRATPHSHTDNFQSTRRCNRHRGPAGLRRTTTCALVPSLGVACLSDNCTINVVAPPPLRSGGNDDSDNCAQQWLSGSKRTQAVLVRIVCLASHVCRPYVGAPAVRGGGPMLCCGHMRCPERASAFKRCQPLGGRLMRAVCRCLCATCAYMVAMHVVQRSISQNVCALRRFVSCAMTQTLPRNLVHCGSHKANI